MIDHGLLMGTYFTVQSAFIECKMAWDVGALISNRSHVLCQLPKHGIRFNNFSRIWL